MLHVKNCLFYGAPLYTWDNFGVSFLKSAAFSLHLSRDIDHILCYNFSTPNEAFSPYKKSLRNHVGSGDICRTI